MNKDEDFLVSCDTCKKGYLRKESMKEPCMYCMGHSHFELKESKEKEDAKCQ